MFTLNLINKLLCDLSLKYGSTNLKKINVETNPVENIEINSKYSKSLFL